MTLRSVVTVVAALLVVGCTGAGDAPTIATEPPSVASTEGAETPPDVPEPTALASPTATAPSPPSDQVTVAGLPDEGFVISDDVDPTTFVDLDGEVVHELPGTAVARPRFLPPSIPAGPVPLAFPQGGTRWLDPASGRTASVYAGVPLAVGGSVAPSEAGTELELRQGGYPLGSWPTGAAWAVSADHDVVTWSACPEGEECPVEAVDLRLGDRLRVSQGCWVADVTDAGERVDVCTTRGPDGISWLAVTTADGTIQRIGVPRSEGQPDDVPTLGRFHRAWWHDGQLLAQLSLECEVPVATIVDLRRGSVEPVSGGRSLSEATASRALGWTADGRAAVALLDGACGSAADEPGVYLIDVRSGERELVHALRGAGRSTVHLWSGPGPDLDALDAPNVGHAFAFVSAVDADARTVTLDRAEWLTGDAADEAAIEDGEIAAGETVPNGFYVRNPVEETEVVEVAPYADVVLTSWEGNGHQPGVRTPATLGQVATHLTTVGGVESFWATLLDGRVVQLEQQYRP